MPLTKETSNNTWCTWCSQSLNSRQLLSPKVLDAQQGKGSPEDSLLSIWGMKGVVGMFLSLNSFFFFFSFFLFIEPISLLVALSYFSSPSSLNHIASQSTEFSPIFPCLYPLWEWKSSSTDAIIKGQWDHCLALLWFLVQDSHQGSTRYSVGMNTV